VVYAVNTAGNILGACVTGFVLLPAMGIQTGVVILAALNLAAALWALWPTRLTRGVPPILAVGCYAGVAALVLVHGFAMPGDREKEGDRTLFYKEGAAATVKVISKAYDPTVKQISVDGTAIGSTDVTMDLKQQVLAHLPFLLHPDIRSVLSIGLGSGILIGEVARRPQVDEAVCVEISAAVVDGAREFSEENHRIFENRRVKVVHDDGINFLLRSRRTYDAIISDAKSRPEYSGNASFFSRDYYELARDHLTPDGVMVQWVPAHLPPRDYAIVLRTFASVFPEGGIWLVAPGHTFLVGSATPFVVDFAAMRGLWAKPYVDRMMGYGFDEPATLISSFVTDWESLRPRLTEVRENTLDHAILEFYSPKDYAVQSEERIQRNVRFLLGARRFIGDVWPVKGEQDLSELRQLGEGWTSYYEAIGLLLHGFKDLDRAGKLFEKAIADSPANGRIRYQVAHDLGRLGLIALGHDNLHLAGDLLSAAVGLGTDMGQEWFLLGTVRERLGQRADAVEAFQSAVRINPNFLVARLALAADSLANGNAASAIAQYREVVDRDDQNSEALSHLGLLLTAVDGDSSTAFSYLERALARAPKNPEVLDRVACAYLKRGDIRRATVWIRRARKYGPDNAQIRDHWEQIRQRDRGSN